MLQKRICNKYEKIQTMKKEKTVRLIIQAINKSLILDVILKLKTLCEASNIGQSQVNHYNQL